MSRKLPDPSARGPPRSGVSSASSREEKKREGKKREEIGNGQKQMFLFGSASSSSSSPSWLQQDYRAAAVEICLSWEKKNAISFELDKGTLRSHFSGYLVRKRCGGGRAIFVGDVICRDASLVMRFLFDIRCYSNIGLQLFREGEVGEGGGALIQSAPLQRDHPGATWFNLVVFGWPVPERFCTALGPS